MRGTKQARAETTIDELLPDGVRSAELMIALPTDQLSTGVRRRYEHYTSELAARGIRTTTRVLASSPSPSLRESFAQASTVPVPERHSGPMILIGLGAPALLVVADRLARAGIGPVLFDQCDASFFELLSWRRLRDIRGALRIMLVLFRRGRLARRVVVGYISERDRRRDTLLNVGRRTVVVAPSVDVELKDLPSVIGGAVSRITAPGDFQSPHLERGIRLLLAAAAEPCPVPIELWGPNSPTLPLPTGVVYRGYAARLRDLFTGNTVVFIGNVGGAGVPNKLIEAAAADRAVIVHPSMLDRVRCELRGWTYRSAPELRRVLSAVAAGEPPRRLREDTRP